MKFIYCLIVSCLFLNCNKSVDKTNLVVDNDIIVKKTNLKTSIIEPEINKDGKIFNIKGCGYNYAADEQAIILKLPGDREIEQLKNIVNYSGLPLNFKFYSADINNAVATVIDNQRFIVYDPALFKYADKIGGTYWNSMSILAHEIGHHLSGHTLQENANPLESELEADKFSGFILYKMGATLPQATLAISKLGSEEDSQSHPAKSKRIKAITEGWTEAQGQRHTNVDPPPPSGDEGTFCEEYTYKSLVDSDLIGLREDYKYEISDYEEYEFFEGIVLDVTYNNPTKRTVESFEIKIKKTSPKWHMNVDDKVFTIYLDDYFNSTEISRYCERNLGALITTGRRLKFAFIEGTGGGGTAEIGYLRLTYAKALPNTKY